jgi:hypothetical protein
MDDAELVRRASGGEVIAFRRFQHAAFGSVLSPRLE